MKTFHYARHEHIDDWLRLGWYPHDSLAGTHHGQWSVLMEWLCSCHMVRPA